MCLSVRRRLICDLVVQTLLQVTSSLSYTSMLHGWCDPPCSVHNVLMKYKRNEHLIYFSHAKAQNTKLINVRSNIIPDFTFYEFSII